MPSRHRLPARRQRQGHVGRDHEHAATPAGRLPPDAAGIGPRGLRSTTFILLALSLGLASSPADARQVRSQLVLRQFQAAHPCPGFQKDHIMALECGGADAVWNLEWLTVAEHKTKTRWDNARCGHQP